MIRANFTSFFNSARGQNSAKKLFRKFSQDFSAGPVFVPKDKMCSLEDFPEDGLYELMFATKNGLPISKFPITHSAIALRNPENGTCAIYGRQSPFDYSIWFRKGLNIRTRKDNEKHYLHKSFGFTAYPTRVLYNKDEIDIFLSLADKLINEKQSCNMVNSNCYSYSVIAMALAIQCLLSRPFESSAVSRILSVMKSHPLSDHLSLGVLNNQVVVDKLLEVSFSVKSHLLSIKNKTNDDSYLLQQILKFIDQVEARNYRLEL